MEVDKEEGLRLRAITSELNVLTRSDGSAVVTQGLFLKTTKIYFPAHAWAHDLFMF